MKFVPNARQRRVVVGLVITGSLCLSVVLTARWLNQPAVVTEVRSATTTETTSTTPSSTELDSLSFTTMVDSELERRQLQPPPQTVLERYRLVSKPSKGDLLAITIAKLPPGGLAEVPDVVLRMRNPETYVPTNTNYLPAGSLLFSANQDAYEQVAFLVHEDKYAAVAVGGRGDRRAQVQQLLQNTLEQWRWK